MRSCKKCPLVLYANGLCRHHFYEWMIPVKRRPYCYGKYQRNRHVRKLMEFQLGKCAICGVEMVDGTFTSAKKCIDHDHVTGRTRGLLCSACNCSLGHYEKAQRASGLIIEPYERYLADPPAHSVQEIAESDVLYFKADEK